MSSSVFCLLFAFLSIAEAKFTRGDSFEYANIEGELTLTCRNKTKVMTCRDVFMSPWPYDVYVGPKNFNAEVVKLTSIVGGETQTSVVNYDGKTGRSADVNLGVYSLFQKPLLKVGENRVQAVLLNRDGSVLDSESFNISVTRGKSRTCDAKETYSQNPDDCEHTYSVCQQYFRAQNFCR